MKRHVRIFASALALAFALGTFSASTARAEELYRKSAEVNKMMTKLGRGVANICTGWMEVPKQIAQSIRETDPVTGTFVGTARGIGWTFARTLAGVYETLSFPFPVPQDYVPLIEPEYIITSVWGEPIPVISDPHNNWAEPRVQDYGTGEPVRTGERADP